MKKIKDIIEGQKCVSEFGSMRPLIYVCAYVYIN